MGGETSSTRRYELKKRAGEMAEMRQRITEAAVHLHGTIGPARTTMSAVAKEAGVQRHTVYRYFPTEAELFGACSGHYFTANPWPDIQPWRAISDPRQRLTVALDELYAYYEQTEPMFSNVLRDVELVAAIGPAMAPLQAFMGEATEILGTGWPACGRKRDVLRAALLFAIDFLTWRALASNTGITRPEAVALVSALVEAAASPPGRVTP
jgi:AcrR family transcriptional regulator